MSPKRKDDDYLVHLWMDSGAYGAWKRSQIIDIHEYVDYIHKTKHLYEEYVNLDKIPGGLGKMKGKADQAEIEESARVSFENLQIMHKEGLKPLPVFHQGERFYWLEKLLGEGEDYIGLATYKKDKYKSWQNWLDKCFTILTCEQGMPLVRTHGFGITDHELLLRYPWWSVDSTTWTMQAAYGGINVPVYDPLTRKFNYNKRYRTIIMSDRRRPTAFMQSSSKNRHDTMNLTGQVMFPDAIRQYLEEEVGLSAIDVKYDHNLRRFANLRFYQLLFEHTICKPFKNRQASMQFHEPTKGRKIGYPWHKRMVFATGPQHGQYAVLMNKVGVYDRLLSYFDCLNFSIEHIEEFVRTGLVHGYKPITNPATNWKNDTYRMFRRFTLMNRLRKPHKHNRFTGEHPGFDDE